MAKEQLVQQRTNSIQDRAAQLLAGRTTRRGLVKGALGLAGAGSAAAFDLRVGRAQAQDTRPGGPKKLAVEDNGSASTNQADVEAGAEINLDTVGLSGFPDATDTLTIDIANTQYGGNFESTIPGDWVINTAEPGVLLYGDRATAVAELKNQGLSEKEAEDQADNWYPNGVTQELFEEEKGNMNVVEGQFMVASLGEGTLKVRGLEDVYTIDMPGEEGHNYIVIVRGIYGDDQPNTDRNRTARFTNLAQGGGHATAMRLPKGSFVSSDYINQQLETSHTGKSNCGDGGCTKVTIVAVDLNTGAVGVYRQDGLGNEVKQIYTNVTDLKKAA